MQTKMQTSASIATINLSKLRHNLSVVQSYAPDCHVIAMIKANAYGHGMVPIALALSELGVRHFGVATLSEAALLKQNGITSQILLLGGATWLHAVSTLVESDLTPAMSNIEEIATLGNFANQHGLSQVPVHLDLDTGMSRLGFFVGDYPEASLEPVLSTIKRFPCLRVQGIGMHFASADCDQEFSFKQMHRFEQAIWCFEKTGIRAEMLHLANSAAIFNGWARGDDQLRSLARNYQIGVRPGLMLYGLSPFEDGRGAADLKPILQWDANIVGRKKIPAGEKIGYGCTFATVMETEIAIVRIGYGDGFSRALSNVGALIVAGEKCPVLGRVSMDLITIDVTEVVKKQGAGACGLNARATIIGVNGEAHIRAEELAKQSKTISWEILTCISDRVERVYPP